MSRVSISRAWDETKAIFARDGRLLVAVALALIVLPSVLVGLIVPTASNDREPVHAVLQIVAGLIGIVGQLALVRLAIGPATTVGAAIADGARRFPALLGALLLLLLLFSLLLVIPLTAIVGSTNAADLSDPARVTGAASGAILLIALVILALSARFMFSNVIAGAEKVGPLSILKRSWELTKGHYWRMFALLILLLIVALALMLAGSAMGGLLGALIDPDFEPWSLGTLIASLFAAVAQGAFSVLSIVMLARVYLQLAGRQEAEVSVPSSGA